MDELTTTKKVSTFGNSSSSSFKTANALKVYDRPLATVNENLSLFNELNLGLVGDLVVMGNGTLKRIVSPSWLLNEGSHQFFKFYKVR